MNESNVKPGSETSEFKLAKLVLIAGIGIDAIAIVLEGLKHAGADFGWLPLVMAFVGTLATVLSQLGYTRSRTMVKVSALAPKVGAEVAHLRPLLEEAKAILAEAKAERTSSQPTLPSGPPPSLPE